MAARVLAVLAGAAFVLYPVAIYFSLTHLSPRASALMLLGIGLPALALRLRAVDREALRSLAILPWVTAALLGFAALLDSRGLTLLVPTVINAVLLAAFGITLVRPPPMIERFARLQVADLDEDELRWCRAWTWGWALFFVINGGIALLLAIAGPLVWWALYSGLLSYIAMGCLFGVEYTVRKYRFGRLGSHGLDRALAFAFATLRRTTLDSPPTSRGMKS